MNLLDILLKRRRMVLTAAGMLSLMGWLAWVFMPRAEDPNMPNYWANIVTIFPGADAETVERLVLEPLEDELAEVMEISHSDATAMAEMALINLELQAGVDVEIAWDEVEDALAKARQQFPEGVGEPVLDRDTDQQASIVLAVGGHNDPVYLAEKAKQLKKELQSVEGVSSVDLIGDPGEQITILYDDYAARRYNLDPRLLALQLKARNLTMPGGSVKLAGKSVSLRPHTDFQSVEEIRNTPILLPSGNSVPLSEIAEVRFGPEDPLRGLMRHHGERVVGLEVMAREGSHLVHFGEGVRDYLEEARERFAPLTIDYVIYQPERVEARLSDLGRSLLMGILIVAGLLLVTMGFRLGFVVASVVPLVALSSLAIYAAGGGVLQQISIAALVIALGMLVDNAIVMAENIQWRIDDGEEPHHAALEAVKEMAAPLFSATTTTLAAFVPMLVAEGTTSEFTRAIPIVIMLTLTVSYLFAVFVTPTLSELFLRKRDNTKETILGRFSEKLAEIAIKRYILVLIAATVLVIVSFGSAGMVRQQFFPDSDRDQVMVEVKLPEGSHLDETDKVAFTLERALESRDDVDGVTAWVGRSAPRFYYNIQQIPWSPHFAQLVVNTKGLESVDDVMSFIRDFSKENLPQYQIVPSKLEQGPPVKAPVEIRVYGRTFEGLNQISDQVLALLRDTPGAVDARHDMSLGAPSLKFEIDDAGAARFGISRADVAATLFGKTRGLDVGQYRMGEDPAPVVLRSAAGERMAVSDLESIDVATPGGEPVPLGQLARMNVDWRPASISHRNRSRVVHVTSLLQPGYSYSDVLRELQPKLETLKLPRGYRIEFGGAAEGSGKANNSMMIALPWGVMLLFGILLAEFNSFRRVGIILVTIPLSAAGVVPGLLFGNQPFGFMSFLGVVALVGVVVNNAIVLLDVIETLRGEGLSLEYALKEAVRRRTRPILLTTATTVAGLLPLALSPTSLWPPLAWSMISGLIASTMLTLMVVPSLYLLLFRRGEKRDKPSLNKAMPAVATLIVLGMILHTTPVAAGEPVPMSLQEVLQRAKNRPAGQAVLAQVEAAGHQADAAWNRALMPNLDLMGALNSRDRNISIETPIGEFELGEQNSGTFNARVTQPLLDPAGLFYRAPGADAQAGAVSAQAARTLDEITAQAAILFLQVVSFEQQMLATDSFIKALETGSIEMEERVRLGRVLQADLYKVQLELDRAKQQRFALAKQRETAMVRLGHAVGLSEPVVPAYPTDWQYPEIPDYETALAKAKQLRGDLRALDKQIKAKGLEYKAVWAEGLPKLEAVVNYSYADGEPFQDGSFLTSSLQVTWRPFSGGTRKPRQAAANAELKGLQARKLEMERNVEGEILEAYAAIETAKGAQHVAERGVVMAEESLRVERERHGAGRVTTNDLLAAEAAYRQSSIDLKLARVEVLKAIVQLKLAMGSIL